MQITFDMVTGMWGVSHDGEIEVYGSLEHAAAAAGIDIDGEPEGEIVTYPEATLLAARNQHDKYGSLPALMHAVADRWKIVLGYDVKAYQVAACLASYEAEKLRRYDRETGPASLANFVRDCMTGLSEYPFD